MWTGTCSSKPVQLLTGSNATSSVHGSDQCQWYDAPVTRRSRPRLYEPVYWLARRWVLNGRQFSLSHIAHVLLDNATSLLVSTPNGLTYFSCGGVAGGSPLVSINEVTLRRAPLVLGWVNACGRVNHIGL